MTWSAPIDADGLDVPRAADAGHLRSERLRELHRERADSPRRAVDEDLLARLNAGPCRAMPCSAVIAAIGTAAACSNVRFGRFVHDTVLAHADVLGEGAPLCRRRPRRPAGTAVTSLPTASTVPAKSTPSTWLFGLRSPACRRTRYGVPVSVPVERIDGSRVNADEDAVVRDGRPVDLPELEDVG